MTAWLWLHNLAAHALQVSVLVIAAALLEACVRLRVPRARLAYWQILLLACLFLPALQPWKPSPALPAAVVSTQTVAIAPSSASHGWGSISWVEVAVWILCAGATIRAVWLALGFWRLRRYRRDARLLLPPPEVVERVQSQIGVQAHVYLSPDLTGPVTYGIRNPVVLFPVRFLEMETSAQEAITCHELLHVQRRDWLFTVLEEVIRTIFWFHPAMWWLLSQIQLAREQTVDREVVALTQDRDRYLHALLAIAAAKVQPDLAPAPLFLRKRHLARRVASIVKEVVVSKNRLIFSLSFCCSMLVLAGWLAVRSFPLQAQPQDERYVVVDTGSANLLHRANVEYPREALAKRIEGAVVLELTVNESGNVSDARVLSGPEELRRAALQSVLQWHYAKDTQLPAKLQVTINFKLPEGPGGTYKEFQGLVQFAKVARGVPGGVAGGVIGGTISSAPVVVPRGGVQDGALAIPVARDLGVLKQIETSSLSNTAAETLTNRLERFKGQTITTEVEQQIRQIVLDTDEHLTVGYQRGETGTHLRIFVRGQGPFISTMGMAAAAPPAAGANPGGPQRIRVGGTVQANNLISQRQPVYPPLAKQARIQGVVKLNAVISKDGRVENLTVVSGHPLLIPAALEAVKEWIYKPTLLNGQPVEIITEIDVNFTLLE